MYKELKNQPKNVFEQKIMTVRNVTWRHSLTGIGVIKWCCSIHLIRSSLILLLAKQLSKIVITTATQNNAFPLKIESSLLG